MIALAANRGCRRDDADQLKRNATIDGFSMVAREQRRPPVAPVVLQGQLSCDVSLVILYAAWLFVNFRHSDDFGGTSTALNLLVCPR